MFYDDYLERGRSIFAGGIRYLGCTLETCGNTNTADSLLAIKELLFATRRADLEALLDSYFALGGAQAMITVVSRGDLERALAEPEQYRHIFIRIAGLSARYPRLGGVEIMAYHNLGRDKAARIGYDNPLADLPSADEATKVRWLDALHQLGCSRARLG